ncbi:hypothetical protein [Amycolatopsis sp. NPDC057786]|uniref:hypothetical protein n=1 Tax=Amycolatopsis sp. NPDC057786 TaxID=3346250 RepID=UPI00366A77AB
MGEQGEATRWRQATCLVVVCRAVLLGTFVLAGFAAVSAFGNSTAAADTGCDLVDAPTACQSMSVTAQIAGPAEPIAVPATNSVASLVNTTVARTSALVGSAVPTLAPAIKQVGSAVETAATLTRTVDTVVRDAVTTVSRTVDTPVTNALSGTVSAIAPVVSSTGLQPGATATGVVTITATVTVSADSTRSSAPRPQPTPAATAATTTAASAAPRTTPAPDLPATPAPVTPLGGGCAFCVSEYHALDSVQRSIVTAAPAGIGSQRPVDRLPLGFPAAPIGAVGSGNGTSSAGSGGGHAHGAIVLPGRAAHDRRLGCWSVTPDDVAPLRMRAQQPPVSPD